MIRFIPILVWLTLHNFLHYINSMSTSDFKKITEQDSHYTHLEKKSISDIVYEINNEDKKVAYAVEQAQPQIVALIEKAAELMANDGRIFYLGAGTSGRLGVLDASECPPTYGVPSTLIQGIIAGGNKALKQAVEQAEDATDQAWQDLREAGISVGDMVIGIASSGTTPYVVEGLRVCQNHNIVTGSIACNPNSPVSKVADFPIEVIVGPEYVTGSTRMKAGTAQKLVLNTISTALMIRYGRVENNKMVKMIISNEKLFERGVRMLMQEFGVSRPLAVDTLKRFKDLDLAKEELSSVDNLEG